MGDTQWKSASFRLPHARLLNGQNRGANFRLVILAPAFAAGRREQNSNPLEQVLQAERSRALAIWRKASTEMFSRPRSASLR